MKKVINPIKITAVIVSSLALVLLFQNCGGLKLQDIDAAQKAKVLDNSTVFGDNGNPQLPPSDRYEDPAYDDQTAGTDVLVSDDSDDNTGTDIPIGSNPDGSGSDIPIGTNPGGSGSDIPIGSNPGGSGSDIPIGNPGGTGSDIPIGTPGGSGSDIPIQRVCTDEVASEAKTVLSKIPRMNKMESVFYKVKDAEGNVICDEKINQKNNIMNSQKIVVSAQCLSKLETSTLAKKKNSNKQAFKEMSRKIAGKKKRSKKSAEESALVAVEKVEKIVPYDIYVYSPSVPGVTLGKLGNMTSLVNENGQYVNQAKVGAKEKYLKLANRKANRSLAALDKGTFKVLYDAETVNGRDNQDPKCDNLAEPLIVSLGEEREIIELGSQENGIFFDVLGANSYPVPYAKKKVSWFVNSRHPFYFVTLPNAQGEVNGINELFGDNTLGPDNSFAIDGYDALSKYDANRDGYIKRNDAIYFKLRLWHDTNLDGVAQDTELHSLESLNVEVIDLHFERKYFEKDQYGNETRRRSVVKTSDGKLHPMFDLWFKYQSK